MPTLCHRIYANGAIEIRAFAVKAEENLASATSELANGRYNACANRCYYACFHAGIVALLRAGVQPQGDQWGHGFVQARFAGELVLRRKLYPAALRDALRVLFDLRQRADYTSAQVSSTQGERGLRRAREFVTTVLRGGERQ